MRPNGRLTVIGDALLDCDLVGEVHRVAPDAPAPVLDVTSRVKRPGGAALAATLAASDGRPVVLVTALGPGPAGEALAALLDGAGVEVVDIKLGGPTPEKVRARAGGHLLLRMDHGGAPPPVGPLTPPAAAAVAGAGAVLVADYGRGITRVPTVREALARLAARSARPPIVWDPHPRGPNPVPSTRLATPNRSEAGVPSDADLSTVTSRARSLIERWSVAAVAVTLGTGGAVYVEGDGPPLAVPASRVARADPCGAGDCFAAAAAGMLADGALPSEAVAAAVRRASEFVAAGGASAATGATTGAATGPPAFAERDGFGDHDAIAGRDAIALAGRVRAAGGTVVATGGCFDLLHAGHVCVLQAARRLGDCLVVCLNSDASVRRLKGEGRPLQPVADRARVLAALDCVDAVAVFDEETPEAVLALLRPHVFAKGADYAARPLPEAAAMARWGGQAVVLPYVEGRSTTRLLKEAIHACS